MSSDAPFASGMYAEAIGKNGEKAVVDEVLNSTFQYTGNNGNPSLDSKEMEGILKALQKPRCKNW